MWWVASERVAPVTVSCLAAIAMALPVLFLGTRPGLEILRPMALVLVGGVVTTALVTLLVAPALYLHLAPVVRYGADELDASAEMAADGEDDADLGSPRGRTDPDRGVTP
jgi:membrane-associated PAP2 superfamily phosphatase